MGPGCGAFKRSAGGFPSLCCDHAALTLYAMVAISLRWRSIKAVTHAARRTPFTRPITFVMQAQQVPPACLVQVHCCHTVNSRCSSAPCLDHVVLPLIATLHRLRLLLRRGYAQDPDAGRPGGPAKLAAAMGASTGELTGVLDAFVKDIEGADSLASTVRGGPQWLFSLLL